MIRHSQPHITPFLSEKICNLLQERDFVSPSVLTRVKKSFMEKFYLNNLFFSYSGSHAIYWILKGLNLKKSDEVIIPSYACPSILHALINAGVTPVLCDIGDRWHMTPKSVEKVITNKTKAILIVNLYGSFINCCDFIHFNVPLINDLCQCPNIFYKKDQYCGDFMAFSFHPTKYLNAGGYGAFSVLNDKYVERFRNNELLEKDISNLNLIVLEEQLNVFEEIILKRKNIASAYFSNFSSENTVFVSKQNNAFYRFPLTQDKNNFEQLQNLFFKKKVIIKRGVDQLIHRILNIPDCEFPNTLKAYNSTISIPIYPGLKDDQIDLIINTTREFLHG